MKKFLRLGNVGAWHRGWQEKLTLGTENRCESRVCDGDGKCRRTDVEIKGSDIVIEIQHSNNLDESEVVSRTRHYAACGKRCLWIIDGSACGATTIKQSTLNGDGERYEWMIDVKGSFIKKFLAVDFVLLDIDGEVFYIVPKYLEYGTTRVSHAWTQDEACDILKDPSRHGDIFNAPLPENSSDFTVWQYPAGSGKTYRLVENILCGLKNFEKYSTFLMLTKPHSAKEVIKQGFEDQIIKRGIQKEAEGEEKKAYWYKLKTGDRRFLVIMATMDSFIYKIGDEDSSSMDPFESMCKMISEHGPKTRNGTVNFKGHSFKINGTCLITIDEATKLHHSYLNALLKLSFVSKSDVLVVGDKLQSLEFEENLHSTLLDDKHNANFSVNIKKHYGHEIRRHGPRLTEMLNKVIPFKEYGLPCPVSSTCVERESDGIYEFVYVDDAKDNTRKKVDKIMTKVRDDAINMSLLPNDIIVVSPLVRNNPLMDELCDEMHDFFEEVLQSESYRHQLVSTSDARVNKKNSEYLSWFDSNLKKGNERHLCILHYSDDHSPVNTSTSTMSVRMVSVHAAQGDTRRYAICVNLNEKNIKVHTGDDINVCYHSFKLVSLSRQTTKLVMCLTMVYDEVYRSFLPLLEGREEVKPTFLIKNSIYLDTSEIEDYNDTVDIREKIKRNLIPLVRQQACEKPLIPDSHHLIRHSVYNIIFFLTVLEEKQERQQAKVLWRELVNARIKTCSTTKEYYEILRQDKNNDNDLDKQKNLKNKQFIVPIRRYKNDDRTYNKILEATKNAMKFLKNFFDNENSYEDLDALSYVMMYHMLDILRHKDKMVSKIRMIYDLAKNPVLQNFYDVINSARSCGRRVRQMFGIENKNWLIHHPVTHGTSEGKILPFNTKMTIPYIIESDSSVYCIFFKSQISTMNVKEIAALSLFAKRLVSQPMTIKNKNMRFINKTVKTIFIDISSSDIFDVPNSYLKDVEVDDLLVKHIHKICRSQHEKIVHFYRYHNGGDTALDAYEELEMKGSTHAYIGNSFRDASRNSDTNVTTNFSKILSGNLHSELKRYKRRASSAQ